VFQYLFRDPRHLLGCFAFGEDHLRHAVPEGAVVIHLGVAEVFKRHVTQPFHSRFRRDFPALYPFEESSQLVLVHGFDYRLWAGFPYLLFTNNDLGL